MTLVEFLTARLDEDEQVARWAVQYSGLRDRGLAENWDVTRDGNRLKIQTRYEALRPKYVAEFFDTSHRPLANHIALHDPARVLREVEAKRRTIVRCEEEMLSGVPRLVHFAKMTLWEMTRPYSDHPDYREEWRP